MNIDEIKIVLLDNNIKKLEEALSGYAINEQDKFGNNILHYYLKHVKGLTYKPADIIGLFFNKQLNVNERQKNGRFGYTPLHLAVVTNIRSAFDALIEKKADVNVPDENGTSPLFYAVFNYLKDQSNYEHYIQSLLKAGADPDLENKHGVSPRSLADQIANSDVKKFF